MSLLNKSTGGSTVGIDIGSSLIKVVEAKSDKDGIQITALGVAPTPFGTIDNEIVVDSKTLGKALRQLLSDSGISCKKSVSSVSGQSTVVVRIIDVPKMTEDELAESMKWEIERHVPFATDEVVMDYKIIERPGVEQADEQNMEVLLAVAQQEVINGHLEVLLEAGLEPCAIDIEPLASCRSLIDVCDGDSADETVAIVSIGASVTEMGIYRKSLLVFPRTLPIAGDAITRALSQNLGISMEDAETVKRERAVVIVNRVPNLPQQAEYSSPAPQETTVAPEAAQPQNNFDDNLGFIPGLGYGYSSEPATNPTANTGLPDFDIDMGGIDTSPAPSKPVIDFDLNDDVVSATPRSHFDLSMPDEAPSVNNAASSASDAQFGQLAPTDLSTLTQERIFDTIEPVLVDLLTEIRRSLEYYTSRYQDMPQKVLLCGGTAKLKDLDKLVQAELGIPVVMANPLRDITVMSKSISQDYLEEVAAVFPVSIGLAIRDMIGD